MFQPNKLACFSQTRRTPSPPPTNLDKGIDVNKAYGNDLTILMWAAGHSNDVPPEDAVKTVELLLTRGAKPELKDNRSKTARIIAADMGHEAVFKVLAAAK